jgi:ribonuclease HII
MLLPYYLEHVVEAGCDEAGRGCLAGPVFAAAVVLPAGFYHPLLNDSKQMTEKNRLQLKELILEKAISYAVASYTAAEIDQVNILNASIYSMHRALEQLIPRPDHIIVDGNRFKDFRNIPYQTVIKGDGKYASIAAASVLAKTFRDGFMEKIHQEYPQYGWNKNKGYPTKDHRTAIKKFGITPYHRKSFRLLDEQLTIDFGI